MRLPRPLPQNREAHSGSSCRGRSRTGQLNFSSKNLGDALGVPVVYFATGQLVFLLAGLFRFLLGCHGCLFSLPLFMDNVHGSCNDDLLQLSECIESLKSEVKQNEGHCEAPKEKFWSDEKNFSRNNSELEDKVQRFQSFNIFKKALESLNP